MTTGTDIRLGIDKAFSDFAKAVALLSDQVYASPQGEKWSAAQHLDHLIRATRPICQAFSLPGFVLRICFGKANRVSRSYDDMVARYTAKLSNGGRAGGRFVPPVKGLPARDAQVSAFLHLGKKLQQKAARCSEEKLDSYILPHPLLGKITLREMLFFTIYHTRHHQQLLPQT